jgi:hypothetical protein
MAQLLRLMTNMKNQTSDGNTTSVDPRYSICRSFHNLLAMLVLRYAVMDGSEFDGKEKVRVVASTDSVLDILFNLMDKSEDY